MSYLEYIDLIVHVQLHLIFKKRDKAGSGKFLETTLFFFLVNLKYKMCCFLFSWPNLSPKNV